jgi:hypothetical protein
LQQLFLCLQPKLLSISCVWNFILMRAQWERNSGSHFHFVQTVWKYIGGSNSLGSKNYNIFKWDKVSKIHYENIIYIFIYNLNDIKIIYFTIS